MRKIIIVIVLSCFTGLICNAQVKSGLKLGYGNAEARGNSETDAKQSYKIGYSFDISLSSFFSLRPSLFFTNRGYEYSKNGIGITANANYFEVPISLAYKLNLARNIRFSINIGPYFAYGIGGKTKFNGDGYNEKWKTFEGKTIGETEYAAVERFDWGGTAGLSFELFMIHVGINYDLGLKDIYMMEKPERREHMKNGMWWLSAGFIF